MVSCCIINLVTVTGTTPLSVAVRKGHAVFVSQFITARCNVDLAMANGSTPLLVAVREGHTVIVSQIITAHCDVDLVRMDGATPLYVAAFKGHSPIVSQLITARCGVSIVLKKHGMTPLFNDEGRDILLLWYNSLLLVPTSTFLRQQLGQHRFSLLKKMGTLPS